MAAEPCGARGGGTRAAERAAARARIPAAAGAAPTARGAAGRNQSSRSALPHRIESPRRGPAALPARPRGWRRRSCRSGCGRRRRWGTPRRTCLHWACKRNHAAVVAQLLLCGADKEILSRKGERPAQLTSHKEIRRMLGVEEDELPDVTTDSELPIIPNYLANPPFPYVYNSMSSSLPEPPVNGSASHGERQSSASSLPPAAQLCVRPSARCEDAAPAVCAGLRCSGAAAQSALLQAPWGTAPPSPAGPQQPGAPLGSGSCAGPVPTFQPVFFTGAFPLNMQELVLKVRIQNPSLKENDFIEIELDRQELTYKELLRVSCRELGVNPEHVQKIRKLPNTMLRKDKDVARLQDFQELELVLTVSDKNFPFRAPALSEQSGYNKKASELTY